MIYITLRKESHDYMSPFPSINKLGKENAVMLSACVRASPVARLLGDSLKAFLPVYRLLVKTSCAHKYIRKIICRYKTQR